MTAKRTGFLAIFSMALLCTWAVGFNVAPSPGSWALLETQDVSGVATVDFASLPTAYRDFKIIGSAVVPVSDGVALLARISIAASWKLGGWQYIKLVASELQTGDWLIKVRGSRDDG
ncbi:hypothetical protein LCGC14_2395700 [marine sediment metagenome]|uniref:Uncharacterized protein n=1 Tax=marine sediment metagenome TaxID=412755 RepID=A0A0F9ERA1_9ZZZZ